jgi:hypothetical protein
VDCKRVHNKSPANSQHTSVVAACAVNFVCLKHKMSSAMNNFFFLLEKISPKKVKNCFLRVCW